MTKYDLNEFIEVCREIGLNVTYQRIKIFESLNRVDTYPTAEEIYQIVKKEYPSISLATVYKTLETFAENNLITKVTSLHDLARYDGNTSPHHHLVCVKCKKIVDVNDDHFQEIKIPESSENGFQMLGYRIQFEGICSNCQ